MCHLGNALPLQLRDGGEQASGSVSLLTEQWSEGTCERAEEAENGGKGVCQKGSC